MGFLKVFYKKHVLAILPQKKHKKGNEKTLIIRKYLQIVKFLKFRKTWQQNGSQEKSDCFLLKKKVRNERILGACSD